MNKKEQEMYKELANNIGKYNETFVVQCLTLFDIELKTRKKERQNLNDAIKHCKEILSNSLEDG